MRGNLQVCQYLYFELILEYQCIDFQVVPILICPIFFRMMVKFRCPEVVRNFKATSIVGILVTFSGVGMKFIPLSRTFCLMSEIGYSIDL